MMGQAISQEVGLKIYKELTNDNMKEIIDTVMMTVNEPAKGLSDAKLQIAAALLEKERTYSSWFDDSTTMIAFAGLVVAGIVTAAFLLIKHKK